MTALQVLTDSFRFYGRLFNKIFWLSVAYTLAPMLLAGVAFGMSQASGSAFMMLLGTVLMFVSISFFYSYQVRLIHQFSDQQNDSLKDAFPHAVNRTMPFLGSMFAMGLFFLVTIVPLMLLAIGLVGVDEDPAQDASKSSIVLLIVMLPAAFFMYRLMFVPMYVIVKETKVIDAFTASNQHIKKNGLVFRGMGVLLLVTLPYFAIVMLSQHMIALSPAAMGFLQFGLNIIVSPFFAVFMYRLFMVSMPAEPLDNPEQEDKDTDSIEDNDHGENH